MSVSLGPKLGLMINALTGDGHDVAFRALLRALDQLPFLAAKNRTTTAPPGSPANGDAYIVATGGTGAWSGHDKSIAVWTTDNPAAPSGEWEFYAPAAGWLAYSVADAGFYLYSGSAWGALGTGVVSVAGRSGAVVLAEADITSLVSDLAATEKTANKGVANGYASLDSGSRVPLAQLPASIVGALQYQGVWDASANSPALASGVGTKGFFYKVSVAGGTTLDGNAGWHIGDLVIFDGTVWDKVDNYEAVTSVAGRTGAVVIAEADVTSLVSDLALKAPLASPALTGSPTAPTQSALDNSTKLGTTAYVDAAVAVEKTRALAAEALAPSLIVGVNTQTASYTAVLGDAGKLVRMNVASANNFTIPPNSSVAFPLYTVISIRQIGAGITTIVAGAGVTVVSPATLAIARKYGTVQIIQVATDTWDLMGDVT